MFSNRKVVLEAWLVNLCKMLPEVKRAVVVCDVDPPGNPTPSISWPVAQIDSCDLCIAASLAISRKSPILNLQEQTKQAGEKVEILVAYPLRIDGEISAAVSLSMLASPGQQDIIVQLLDWGQSWLQLVLLQLPGDFAPRHTYFGVLQACLGSRQVRTSANAVATEVARNLECQRASIGLLEGKEIRLKGISNTPGFDPKTRLTHNIEEVMAETRDHGSLIVYGKQPRDVSDVSAHQQLAQGQEAKHICSVPMFDCDQIIGVLVLERNLKAFDAKGADIDPLLLELLGKSFALQLELQMGPIERLKRRMQGFARQYLRAGSIRLKLATAVVVVACSFIIFVPGEFRISSDAVLEGSVQRAIVAPFDGYVSTANARAGDIVRKDEVIAELDDSELRLEQRRWLGQRDEYDKQYRNALAILDHSAVSIFRSQVAQAEAQLDLIANQLRRVKLVSPLDGIIISGDLSRVLGIPLERGQLLFEVAPLDEYRLILNIDERDIVHVRQGQTGLLTLAAFPRREISFVVQKVAVLHQQDDVSITYRTEASIEFDVSDLRPGMQGIGKIYIENRNYLWIWTRRMADWLRMNMWAWIP